MSSIRRRKLAVCVSTLIKDIADSRRSSIESTNVSITDERIDNHVNNHTDRIVLNVGGMRHETFKSTLKIFPDTRLGWIAINGSESVDSYDSYKNEYFFDRHPNAFLQIINFYRTGKLHAPSDICGPLFEEELAYWGLEEKSMEPCCWSKYTEHRDAQENLKVFDNPDLNPIDEEADQILRNEQALEDASENNGFLQRLYKTIKPSCFRSGKWMKFKHDTWKVFEDHSTHARLLSKIVSIISLTFILLSVLSICFHSMLNPVANQDHPETACATNTRKILSNLLLTLDVICVTWFTIEFSLRFLSSPNRISFMLHIMNIVDFLTIVPYFIQFPNAATCYLTPTYYAELISIARLFRLFRFFRLSTGLEILKHTLIASSKELLLLLLLLLIPVAVFATIVYYCERNVKNTKFKTIPESLWWAIITMTTVGYGDMSPKTTIGKVFGAMCAAMSVLILALPVSIIGNNFTLFYHYAQARLKLPKRPKNALVGAANALVAEPSQQSLSVNEESVNEEEDDDGSQASVKEEYKVNREENEGTDRIGNRPVSYNRRFRRERLSLYVTGPSRNSIRRTRSIGNVPLKEASDGTIKSREREDSVPNSSDRSEDVGLPNESFVSDENANEKRVGNGIKSKVYRIANSRESHQHLQENKDTRHEMMHVPKTIITDCDIENGWLEPIKDSKLHNGGTLIGKYQSPPVQRRYGNMRTPSPDEVFEMTRKRSNNHLYLPPSSDALNQEVTS